MQTNNNTYKQTKKVNNRQTTKTLKSNKTQQLTKQ